MRIIEDRNRNRNQMKDNLNNKPKEEAKISSESSGTTQEPQTEIKK